MSFLLGIEIGTTRIKVGVYDFNGKRIIEESMVCSLYYDATKHSAEAPVHSWFLKIKNLLSKIGKKISLQDISSICIGSHGPSLVALDKNLNPVYNSILWLDKRAKKELLELSQKLDKYIPEAVSFVPKAMWLKNNFPTIFKEVAYFVQPLDYIAAKLTGEVRTSIGPRGIRIWDKEMISASEINKKFFPEQILMGEVIGEINSYASNITGLRKGTVVIAGTGGADFLESLIASRCFEKGAVVDRGGSSQGVNICWDKPLKIPLYYQIEHPFLKNKYHISSVMNTTGKSLEWFKNITFGGKAKYDVFVKEAGSSPAGSKSLIFIPNLADSMINKNISNGFSSLFYGLTLEHARKDMCRAILEGTAYGINNILKTFRDNGAIANKIIASGGQARSDLWNQIKADVTNLPVIVNEDPDGSTLGLAIIAGYGIGIYQDIAEASNKLIRPHKEYLPIHKNREIYIKSQEKYNKLTCLLKNFENE